MNGDFIAPVPLFDTEPANDALAAISFDHEPALQQALKQSIRLGSLSRENETLVGYAARAGAVNTLGTLLDIRRSLATKWEADKTLPPLAEAARNGRLQAVERLVRAGAHKVKSNTQGLLALRTAARNGHADCFELLLENDTPVHDEVRVWGDHPVRIALEAGYSDIAKRAYEASDMKEKTLGKVILPFHTSGEQFDLLKQLVTTVARSGHTSALDWILKQTTIDPNEYNPFGRAFREAIRNGHRDTAGYLLGSGANINLGDETGATPLMFAAESGDPRLVSFCLEHGADLHATDDKGLTALHVAALRNSGVIVTQLLDAGADLSICDTGDLTPLDAALLNRAPDVVEPLVARGACIALGSRQSAALLEAAIRLDVPEPLSRAIDQGWPPDSTFSGIWPALRVAEIFGAEKCAQVLRKAGATADRDRPFPVVAADDLDDEPVALRMEPPLDPRSPDEIFGEQEVRVDFLVDAFGRTLFPKILECPDPRLASPAARSILGTRFSPPRKSGQKVAVMMSSAVSFPSSQDRVFSIEEIEQPPQLTEKMTPPYPADSADRKRGRVVLEFVINREGRAEDITPISSSGDMFTIAAVKMLTQTSFIPARHNGVAVNVRLRRSFDFTPPTKR
jgi:TonB family protein